MVRRCSAGGSSSSSAVFKSGDVVWAPYRRIPRWPSIVRCVYPKKITYVFLPEEQGARPVTFHAAPSKIQPFLPNEKLDSGASDALRAAFAAAVEHIKKTGQEVRCPIPGVSLSNNAEKTVYCPSTSSASSGASPKKDVIESAEESSHDGEEESSWLKTGDVVWLQMPSQVKWPMLIKQVKKKFVMVNSFPLVTAAKTERYPRTACEKFEVRGLQAAIKKERNRELKAALNSVWIYLNGEEDELSSGEKTVEKKTVFEMGISDEKTTEDDSRSNHEAAAKMNSRPSETLKSDIEFNESTLVDSAHSPEENLSGNESFCSTMAQLGSTSSRWSLPEKRPTVRLSLKRSAPSKRPRFSEAMNDLEAELQKKTENLTKGNVVWLYRQEIMQKWPILIVKCDKEKGVCYYRELPVQKGVEVDSGLEECSLKSISLYDSVTIDKEEVADEELRKAIEQADEIVEGTFSPFCNEVSSTTVEPSAEALNENGTVSREEDLQRAVKLLPSEVQSVCESDGCLSFLKQIWQRKIPCERHQKYKVPPLDSLSLAVPIGDILPESSCVSLIGRYCECLSSFPDALPLVHLVHYVATVALPEAVIYSIAKVRNISMDEANLVFAESTKSLENVNGDLHGSQKMSPGAFEHLLKVVSDARQEDDVIDVD
ncbi:hypothetical protein AB6A40_006008 [Gnathostoma spinigerum]|uniref:PWWP domain-containing protein n=1 Tax=Gnathostoma spinigerum TaxID=75299 RepID=A0ABD6EMC3_9BILA